MTNFREIASLRKDAAATSDLAARLLSLPEETFNDRERKFLSDVAAFKPNRTSKFFVQELSTLQIEWLIDIRDSIKDYATTPQGFSVQSLLDDAWLAHQSLDDDKHIEFLREHRGARTLKKRQLGLLLHICRKLGLIEEYV